MPLCCPGLDMLGGDCIEVIGSMMFWEWGDDDEDRLLIFPFGLLNILGTNSPYTSPQLVAQHD